MTPEELFLDKAAKELGRARAKFPDSQACVVALMEEVGELAKAMLEESPDRQYEEAVQVAVMAMRVALEGDSTLAKYNEGAAIRDGLKPKAGVDSDGDGEIVVSRLDEEIERNEELLKVYEALPVASGWFGSASIKTELEEARAARVSGDEGRMQRALDVLKDNE